MKSSTPSLPESLKTHHSLCLFALKKYWSEQKSFLISNRWSKVDKSLFNRHSIHKELIELQIRPIFSNKAKERSGIKLKPSFDLINNRLDCKKLNIQLTSSILIWIRYIIRISVLQRRLNLAEATKFNNHWHWSQLIHFLVLNRLKTKLSLADAKRIGGLKSRIFPHKCNRMWLLTATRLLQKQKKWK